MAGPWEEFAVSDTKAEDGPWKEFTAGPSEEKGPWSDFKSPAAQTSPDSSTPHGPTETKTITFNDYSTPAALRGEPDSRQKAKERAAQFRDYLGVAPDSILGATPESVATLDVAGAAREGIAAQGASNINPGRISDAPLVAFLSDKTGDSQEDADFLKEVASKPTISLPTPAGNEPAAIIARTLINGVSAFSTPQNIQLAASLGPAAGGPLAKAVATGFSADMLHSGLTEIGEGINDPTTEGKIEKITSGILSTALGAGAGGHGLGREDVLPEGIKREPGLSQEEVDRAVTQNQLRALGPEPVPLTKDAQPMDEETMDGLHKTKAALVKQLQGSSPGVSDQIQASIDDVDAQLLRADRVAVQESAARVAQRGESPPPAEGEVPPTETGGPPANNGRSSLFSQALKDSGITEPTPPEAPVVEPITDPALHQAAEASAQSIADAVTKGQPDTVREAAYDAAIDNARSSLKNGKSPSASFMRKAAQEAAGKAAQRQGESLNAKNDAGTTKLEATPSGEASPAEEAAKADTIKEVQDTIAKLPEHLQDTATKYLAASEGGKPNMAQLAKDLKITPQGLRERLKAMQTAFEDLRDRGDSMGPGAASANEPFVTKTITGIRNALTEAKREELGMAERDAVGKRAFGPLWDEARAAFDANEDVGKELVSTLKEDPSLPLSDTQDAVLTHEMADRQADYDRAVDRVKNVEGEEEHAAAKEEFNKARDALHEIFDVSEKAGTATGRGLNARKLMIREDYTLVNLERQAIAKTGEKLTPQQFEEQFPEQHAKLVEMAKENEALSKEVEKLRTEHEATVEDTEAQRLVQATVEELGKAYLAKPQFGKKVFDIARGIVDRWKEEAKTAHNDLQKALGNTLAGVPNPAIVIHVAKILRAKIGEFGLDKTEAFAEMVSEYGPKVQEHLEKGWAKAKQLISSEKGDEKAKEVAGGGIGKKGEKTPVEAKAESKAEAVAGEKLSQKTIVDHVRALINEGEHDTNELMRKTTEALKEHFPDLTERDVRRAFVDYGHKIYPSKEAVEVEIRENKQIVKIQEDIDREMERLQGVVDPNTGELIGAEKQGFQRDKPTQKVRELIKQRNELLKKRQGPDSPEKLASRDQAKQTALRNAIADLDKRLKTGGKPTKGEPVPDSTQTEQLRAEKNAMQAKLDEIEASSKPVLTPDERYNATRIKQVQKELAEKQTYLDQLKKTGVIPPKPPAAVKTKFAELAKKDAELVAKRREIKDTIAKIAYDNRSIPTQIKDAIVKTLKLVTSVKILGHGTVGMFTHAGGLAWRPTVAKIFWQNFGRQFKLWTSKAYHDQAVFRLKNDPEFETWKNAGASIDPEQTYTDYGLYAKWLGKLGEAGGRGFDALKLTRLELNKANWDKVPASVKADPVAAAETRKAIADINNKATGAIPRVSPVTPEGAPNRITNGVYNLAKNPVADAVFFAPKLYASRWARVVLDPVKTIGTLADWENASIADKTAAKIRLKNAGQFTTMYVGALLVNQGLLKASGSDQEVNITDPTRADWLKFKGAGKEIVADGGLLDPLRLLGQIVVGDILNVRTKNQQYREGTRYQKITDHLGKYARSKFNPTLGLAVDSATGTDYAGKPLPFSNEPPKFKDQEKYTWGEWLMQQGPIPLSQGVKVAYDEMRKNGMSHLQIISLLKGAAVAAIGGTGIHVTEDHPHTAATPTASRHATKRR